MYKVFVNDTPIILSTRKDIGNIYFSIPIAEANIVQIIKNIKKGTLKYVNLYDLKRDRLIELFKRQIKPIEAGGGIVKNQNGEMLFIFRKGKWDLPKGKLEKGERIEEAALREVEEETGVQSLKITDKTPHITYHVMKKKGEYRLKVTHWFQMETNDKQELTPQKEEDITKAEWKSPQAYDQVLKNSYGNIKLLLA